MKTSATPFSIVSLAVLLSLFSLHCAAGTNAESMETTSVEFAAANFSANTAQQWDDSLNAYFGAKYSNIDKIQGTLSEMAEAGVLGANANNPLIMSHSFAATIQDAAEQLHITAQQYKQYHKEPFSQDWLVADQEKIQVIRYFFTRFLADGQSQKLQTAANYYAGLRGSQESAIKDKLREIAKRLGIDLIDNLHDPVIFGHFSQQPNAEHLAVYQGGIESRPIALTPKALEQLQELKKIYHENDDQILARAIEALSYWKSENIDKGIAKTYFGSLDNSGRVPQLTRFSLRRSLRTLLAQWMKPKKTVAFDMKPFYQAKLQDVAEQLSRGVDATAASAINLLHQAKQLDKGLVVYREMMRPWGPYWTSYQIVGMFEPVYSITDLSDLMNNSGTNLHQSRRSWVTEWLHVPERQDKDARSFGADFSSAMMYLIIMVGVFGLFALLFN